MITTRVPLSFVNAIRCIAQIALISLMSISLTHARYKPHMSLTFDSDRVHPKELLMRIYHNARIRTDESKNILQMS